MKRKCPGRHETPAPERLERRTNDVHPESHVVAIVCEPLHWCAGDPTGELNLSTEHSRPTRFLVRVIVQNMQFRLLPGGASSYDCLPERSSICAHVRNVSTAFLTEARLARLSSRKSASRPVFSFNSSIAASESFRFLAARYTLALCSKSTCVVKQRQRRFR